jgi:hypothetical protein
VPELGTHAPHPRASEIRPQSCFSHGLFSFGTMHLKPFLKSGIDVKAGSRWIRLNGTGEGATEAGHQISCFAIPKIQRNLTLLQLSCADAKVAKTNCNKYGDLLIQVVQTMLSRPMSSLRNANLNHTSKRRESRSTRWPAPPNAPSSGNRRRSLS